MLQNILCYLNMHKWGNIDAKLTSEFRAGKRVAVVRYTYFCKHCNQRKVTVRPLQ